MIPRMKPLLFLAPFALAAALAGCSEQQMCVYQNTQDLRAAESRISELEGNVARGFAIFRTTEPFTYTGVCRTKEGKPYPCTKTDFRTVEKPVAIDVADQRRQLAALKAQLPALQKKAESVRAQCAQRHPE